MAKPKLGLKNQTPDQIVATALTIKTAMTGNANFLTPNPSLTTVGTLVTTAQTKIAAYNSAISATSNALTDRDNAIQALTGALTTLAAYVENITGGDRLKIESAGMSVRSSGSPIGTPDQVTNLQLGVTEFDGALNASWDPVRGAGSYEIQTSVDPVTGTSWVLTTVSNISSLLLEGFTSGTKMWVRVRAVGAGNERGGWSDPAGKTVP